MINVSLSESNLCALVPRADIQEEVRRLNGYIMDANDVTRESTFAQINHAEKNLHMAQGLYPALKRFRAVMNWIDIEEDLRRIESKIIDIRLEKNRNCRPEVRQS